MNKNAPKIIIAVVLLAVAGFLVARQMGLFGSSAPQLDQNRPAPLATETQSTTTTNENTPPVAGQLPAKKPNF